MAAAFGARFRRGREAATKAEPRVGEILSDSSEGSSSVEIKPRAVQGERKVSRSHGSSTESRGEHKNDKTGTATRKSKQTKRSGGRKWYSDSDSDEDAGGFVKVSAVASMASRSAKRMTDSSELKDDDEAITAAQVPSSDPAMDAPDAESAVRSAADEPERTPSEPPCRDTKEKPKLKRLADLGDGTKSTSDGGKGGGGGGVLSPSSDAEASRSGGLQHHGKKQTSFQKLVAKTKTLSPFAARNKGIDSAAGPPLSEPSQVTNAHGDNRRLSGSSGVSEHARDSPAPKRLSSANGTIERGISQRRGSKLQVTTNLDVPTSPMTAEDVSSPGELPSSTRSNNASDLSAQAPMPLINRRMSRLKQSPSHSDYGSGGSNTPRSGDMSPAIPSEAAVRRTFSYETPDSMSPGQRKQPGAFPGQPGSGVLLEGWLRQKQRRGMKGMKKWNSRYFVLYSKTNEVRYYADVVPSAWGPIPLGEIGSISLRLIQRIGKPSHPKYKGCRFDITCRNTWGTHYADDYVSSDDENSSNNTSNNNNNDEATNTGPGTGGKPDKSGTPKSSRVYSLIADSPQVAVTWMNTLDSLLVRSANSPRPDVNSPSTGSKFKKAPTSRSISRRRSSALDMETVVLCGLRDAVPRAVTLSIHYIFNSSPGVETPHFYELDADPAKLKSALKFLNRFAEADASDQQPGKEELAAALDPVTAGAVVKTWLRQLEQPLIPFEMFPDFKTLAADAATEKFELSRNLKALLDALPTKNRSMVACLLFHLNDVNAYATANEMNAELLSTLFAEFVLRPRPDDALSSAEREDLMRLVTEMIAHVDSFIDESEVEGLP